jgi:hypothetical protein
MVFRSVKIVKAVVHVGSDRIRRVMQEFTRTYEFPLPKPIGRPPNVLTAEVITAIRLETAFYPATSCAQLQRFLEVRDIDISRESIPLASHNLKFL